MSSKKLFATLAVVTAAALAPTTSAHAAAHKAAHGCPACPHPAVVGTTERQLEASSVEYPNLVF